MVWLLHSTWALCLLAAVTTLGIFSGIVDDFAESMPGPAEKINQFSDYQVRRDQPVQRLSSARLATARLETRDELDQTAG